VVRPSKELDERIRKKFKDVLPKAFDREAAPGK